METQLAWDDASVSCSARRVKIAAEQQQTAADGVVLILNPAPLSPQLG